MIKESNTINVYYDTVKIHDYNIEMNCRNEEIVLICPNCMKHINLGRASSRQKFRFQQHFKFMNSKLNVKSIDGYREHISNCESLLQNGINKIDSSSDERLFDIVESLSKWCGKETPFDLYQIRASDFHHNSNEVVAYIYQDKLGPLSYIAYKLQRIKNENNEPENLMFIWDLFTFKGYRKKGFAKKLLDYSLSDLGIDRKRLPVSAKFTSKSAGLIKSFSEGYAIILLHGQCQRIVKDEIDHPNLIMDK